MFLRLDCFTNRRMPLPPWYDSSEEKAHKTICTGQSHLSAEPPGTYINPLALIKKAKHKCIRSFGQLAASKPTPFIKRKGIVEQTSGLTVRWLDRLEYDDRIIPVTCRLVGFTLNHDGWSNDTIHRRPKRSTLFLMNDLQRS